MLAAKELECERGGRVLFRGLSFTLAGGEALRVAGRNGSGKTSLLRILAGLLTPSRGEVRWQGERIRWLREEYARQLVYLGHAPAVKDELTAAETAHVTCTLAGIHGTVGDALDRFGIPADKPVKQLSQGQRRRAALARLVLSERVPLWLLDEPFTALDSAAADVTRNLIRNQIGRGGAIVYTTHQDAGLSDSRVVEL